AGRGVRGPQRRRAGGGHDGGGLDRGWRESGRPERSVPVGVRGTSVPAALASVRGPGQRPRRPGPASAASAGMMAGVTISADFAPIPEAQRPEKVEELCAVMEAADAAGHYPQLIVERPWSVHNRVLEGEFACPRAIRWYLERELSRLAAAGARMSVCPGRR